MKQLLFSTGYSKNILNLWLLIFRVAIGALMIVNALPKLNMLLAGGEIQFIDPLGFGPKLSLILVVMAEFFCSVLLIVGFFTRPATIPLIFTMFVAAFIHHQGDPFSAKQLAIVYMIIYTGFLVTGPGTFSVDRLIRGKKKK